VGRGTVGAGTARYVLALALTACSGAPEAPAPQPPADEPPAWRDAPDEPVGAATCAGCHAAEAAAWAGSHHDHALEVASPATVLGAFDGRSAEGMGQRATFSRDGEAYVVDTTGFDGSPGRYVVAWTFGFAPIQQYLVRFPDGAVHTLPWSWDARPADEGGQQWLPAFPGETIPPGDTLHWAGPNLRWNHMCADCHGTNVAKAYDPPAHTWATTWTDEDVACEACHGNGSRHAAWATTGGVGPDPGLPVALGADRAWVMDPVRGIARREPPLPERVEVETCGRCHSRRYAISEAPPTGGLLLTTHQPAVLDAGLYEADGQIRDEVYEWGSFLQSPMYAAGVTCTDCHDPHAGRTKGDGNALCSRCHDPARFDATAHHHHPAGAACVDCHMPARTYMGVDSRRDHSMRVPRPDLAVSIGVPEPCTGCHLGRDAAWAADAVRGWYPDGRSGRPHPGEAVAAGRARAPDAPDRLAALAADPSAPAIWRATAVSLLPAFPRPAVPAQLRVAAHDPDPLVRREAAIAARAVAPDDRLRICAPLLDDPVLGVRLAAAEALADAPAEALGATAGEWRDAIGELRAVHRLHADRAEAWSALGALDGAAGDTAAAEADYREALRIDPRYTPARVGLADLYRVTARDADGLALLAEGLALGPDAALHHAAGLTRVRLGDTPGALADLAAAARLAPDVPRYAYVHAVALSADRPDEARRVAAAAYERSPGDPDLLVLLVDLATTAGDTASAATWRERALRDAPWAFAGP